MRLQNLEMLTGVMLSVLISAVSVYPANARPLGEAGSEQWLSQTDGNRNDTIPPNRNNTIDTTDAPNTSPTNDLRDTNPTNPTDTNNTPSTGTTNDSTDTNNMPSTGTTNDSTDTNRTNTTDTNRTNTIRRQEQTIQQRTIYQTTPTPAPNRTTAPGATSAPTVEQSTPQSTEQSAPVRALW